MLPEAKVSTLYLVGETLETEPRASHMPNNYPTTDLHPPFEFHETAFHYITGAGLKLVILLPRPPQLPGLEFCDTMPGFTISVLALPAF